MDVCSPLIFLGMRGFFVAYFIKKQYLCTTFWMTYTIRIFPMCKHLGWGSASPSFLHRWKVRGEEYMSDMCRNTCWTTCRNYMSEYMPDKVFPFSTSEICICQNFFVPLCWIYDLQRIHSTGTTGNWWGTQRWLMLPDRYAWMPIRPWTLNLKE